jgi:NTP pyrophosphatase (non-canonical NTP hydrolase)
MPTQKLHPNDSLAHLSAQIKQFAQDRAWDQFHNPKDLALSMVLESAEVLEHFQWKDEKAITKHLAKKVI